MPARSSCRYRAVLDELKPTVPVTIVLLDACRTNPFPAGALVQGREPGEARRRIGAGGLGAPRGVASSSRMRPAPPTISAR